MAILESQPHIEVRVLIEGRPAREYENNGFQQPPPPVIKDEQQTPAEDTIIKCIESVSDATFAVQFTVFPGYQWTRPCLAFLVEVDGHFVNGWTKGSPSGSSVLLRFKFADLSATHAPRTEHVQADKKQAEDQGTIYVRVHRGIRNNRIWVPVNTAPPSSSTLLAEKVLKGRALSHSTSCEDPIPCSAQIADKFHYYDDLDHPLARYIFRYRSREALQQPSIIPRPDSSEGTLANGLRHLHLKHEAQHVEHTQHHDQAAVIDLTLDE